jgi:hypothetical protein
MKIKLEIELDTERDKQELEDLMDIIESLRYRESDEDED